LRNTTFGLIENKHDINIVVYDAQSEHTNQLDEDKSFAYILLQRLVQKFKNVSFLTGGFANFKLEHSALGNYKFFKISLITKLENFFLLV